MSKIWQMYAWGTIIIAFLILFIVGFWLLYPYKTISFNTNESKVLTPEVKKGGLLNHTIDFCKYTNLSADLTRSFIDGVIYTTPTIKTSNPKGCRTNNLYIEIPNLPPGQYKLKIEMSYKVNPVRTIKSEIYTESFMIVE